jgi:hypothetical protein
MPKSNPNKPPPSLTIEVQPTSAITVTELPNKQAGDPGQQVKVSSAYSPVESSKLTGSFCT